MDEMTFRQVESGWEKVVFEIDFDEKVISAETLFDWFTKPELLTQWWAQEATVEPQTGGAYHLHWPSIDKHLLGTVTHYQPNQKFAYIWQWEHQSKSAEKLVEIEFSDGQARITHSAYSDSEEDKADRQSHIDGWNYFLGQLQERLIAIAS